MPVILPTSCHMLSSSTPPSSGPSPGAGAHPHATGHAFGILLRCSPHHRLRCFQESRSRAMAHLTRRVTQIAHRCVGIAAPRSRCAADPPLPKGTTGHAEPSHREALFVGLLPLQRSAILATAMWKQHRVSVGIPCSRRTHGCRGGGSNGVRATRGTWGQVPYGCRVLSRVLTQLWRLGCSGEPGGAGRVGARGRPAGTRCLGVRGVSDIQFLRPCTKGCMTSSTCTPKQVNCGPVQHILSELWVHRQSFACHIALSEGP